MCTCLCQEYFDNGLEWRQGTDCVPQSLKHVADRGEQLREGHLTRRIQRLCAALALGFVEESPHFFHEFIVVEEDADGCLELVEFKLLK